MMYNHWSEQDYHDEPEVKSAEHECVADAVFCIMEQLYDSGNAIDKETLRRHFSYLCDELDIPKGLLKDPNGLCVVHHKEKVKEGRLDGRLEIVREIREPARVLKDELYNTERPLDLNRLKEAVEEICSASSQMVPYGKELTVCRSNGWRHHQ